MQSKKETWLTTAQAADILGMTPRTIRLWIAQEKTGLVYKRVGFRKYRITESSLTSVCLTQEQISLVKNQ